MDPNTFTATFDATYTVGDVDPEKGAAVNIDIRGFKISGTMQGAFKLPETQQLSGRIDLLNHIKLSLQKDVYPATQWLMLDSVELPATEIKVGDTWPITLSGGAYFGEKTPAIAKLEGEKDFNGTSAWSISIDLPKFSYKQKTQVVISTTGDVKDGDRHDATLSGSGNFHCDALVEKGTGRVLSLYERSHLTQNMESEALPDQPAQIVDYVASMKMKR